MTETSQPRVWRHLPSGRRARTAIRVRASCEGSISLPVALVDALGQPDRVHLFGALPGELWICPADDDDDRTGYALTRRPDSSGRQMTVSNLFDRLGLVDAVDTLYGDWTIEDDRAIVRFLAVSP